MPVYKYNNNIIKVNGGVGGSPECCCGIPTVCDCDVINSIHCSELTWSINNFWIFEVDPNGGNAPQAFGPYSISNKMIFPGVGIGGPGIAKNFILPSGHTLLVNRWPTNQCWLPFGDGNIFKLLLFLTFNMNMYCKEVDPANPDPFNVPWVNPIYFEGFVPEPVCFPEGQGGNLNNNISGDYNLNIFGNPCPNGDTTFNVTWKITKVGPFPEQFCPFDDDA